MEKRKQSLHFSKPNQSMQESWRTRLVSATGNQINYSLSCACIVMIDFVETFHDMINTVYCNVTKLEHFLSDSKMECLQLTMTEVLKRQNSKSKKGYNQVSEMWLHFLSVVCGCGALQQHVFNSAKHPQTLQKQVLQNQERVSDKLKSYCKDFHPLFHPHVVSSFSSSWALQRLK